MPRLLVCLRISYVCPSVRGFGEPLSPHPVCVTERCESMVNADAYDTQGMQTGSGSGI